MAASSITGEELGRGVDRGAQRHAVVGVEGQLGAAEQAAAFLGRDAHGVGGLAGDVGGRGAGDVGVLAEVGDRFFDLGDAGDFVAGARRCVAEPAPRFARRAACSGRACWWRRRRASACARRRGSACRRFSDCSSRRTWPSLAIHSRPEAPVISGLEVELAADRRRRSARLAPSSRWLVSVMFALTP